MTTSRVYVSSDPAVQRGPLQSLVPADPWLVRFVHRLRRAAKRRRR